MDNKMLYYFMRLVLLLLLGIQNDTEYVNMLDIQNFQRRFDPNKDN